MAEDNLDLVKSEVKPMTRGERIAAGIGKWVENQMPPAVGERYKKTLTVASERLWGKQPELLAKLQGPIETAAKIAGWADPVVKVALSAAALYGGALFLMNPAGAIAAGSAIVESGKVLGIAAIAAGARAFNYVVTGVTDLGDRVRQTWEKIINPSSAPVYHPEKDVEPPPFKESPPEIPPN
ncbi:MAG: hypothetical protein Q8L37_03155 [Candidatus Gottesmanbacteria bacterium]|nr:hypothetical protein [Candidatus Gottesmanbacteria bacterium]